jgi:hypothetical protein
MMLDGDSLGLHSDIQVYSKEIACRGMSDGTRDWLGFCWTFRGTWDVCRTTAAYQECLGMQCTPELTQLG